MSRWEQVWKEMPEGNVRWKSGESNRDWERAYQYLRGHGAFSRVLVPLAGDSPFGPYAASRGARVTCIDVSPTALARLQERASSLGAGPELSLLLGDVHERLGELQEASFDLVYDKDALGCLGLQEARERSYVRQVERVLAPRGLFYVEGKHRVDGDASQGPPFHLEDERLIALCEEAGLSHVESTGDLGFISSDSMYQKAFLFRKKE